MSAPRTRRGLVLMVGLAALSGCGAGLGERCAADEDCRSGLRCSAPDSLGVCIYAAAPTADRGLADRPILDGPRPDRPVALPDRPAIGDRASPEAPLADAVLPLDRAPDRGAQ